VIDIDPSDKNTFEQAREVTLAAKEVLDEVKVKGYCKTSGKSGMHIYLPLAAEYSYEEARDFTHLLCHQIHEKLPKLTSLERAVKKRKGKIYLDYMQNNRGQTLAAAYCVRPIEGAQVSAPLSWEEVEKSKPADFTIENMPERIAAKGDLFAPVLKEKINIEKVLEKFGEKN
jgi:bifunctional non-homologous end joining protein LigD